MRCFIYQWLSKVIWVRFDERFKRLNSKLNVYPASGNLRDMVS